MRPSGKSWGKFWAGLIAGVVVGALGVAAVAADRFVPVPVAGGDVVPVIVPVVVRDLEQTTSVAVTVVFDAPSHGVIRRSGIVTRSDVESGTQVSDGQVLAWVDDDPVVAMVSDSGPYRDLTLGDTGRDVQALQTWLQGRGFFTGTLSQRFGTDTVAAVKQWQRSLGVEATGHFELGSVIWVGASAPAIAEVTATAGESVTAGEVFFTAAAMPVSVTVVEPPGGIQRDGDQLLTVGSVSVPYVLGSGMIDDADAVDQINKALGASGEGIGRVRSAVPVSVKVMPASAIVTDADGLTCVFGSVDGPAVPVTAQGGGLGGVTVDAGFGLSQVVANPTLVRSELSCG